MHPFAGYYPVQNRQQMNAYELSVIYSSLKLDGIMRGLMDDSVLELLPLFNEP